MHFSGRGVPAPMVAALACAALVVVGSLGTWVTVRIFGATVHVSGAGDGRDGAWTLLLGAAAAGVLIFSATNEKRHQLAWLAAALLVAAAAIGGYDWAHVHRVAAKAQASGMETIFGNTSDLIGVSVGWGLVVETLAAVAGAGFSILLAREPRPGSTPALAETS